MSKTEFVISDGVSTDIKLGECAFGKLRYRGTWKRSSVEVLEVFDVVEEPGEFTEICLREMLTLRAVRHPNIAQVFGVTSAEGQNPRVVSELLDTTLKDRLGTGRPLSNSRRIHILHCVLNGLRYLHELSPPIVHGLLTGESVWISRDLSQVKVTHFRTAKLLLEKGSPSLFHPFEQLIAPEVLQDRAHVSTSSDIYSYGMLVLGTLAGHFMSTSASVALQSIGLDHCLRSVVQGCFRSASDRPTAKEIMSYFPSNIKDSNGIKDEDVDRCSSPSSDEEHDSHTYEDALPFHEENETLKKRIADLEKDVLRLTEENHRLQQTTTGDSERATSDQLEASAWQVEKRRLLRQLQDVQCFHKLKEVSLMYQLSLPLQDERSDILSANSTPIWHPRPDIPDPCETVMAVYEGKVLIGNRGRNKMYVIDGVSGELLKTVVYSDSDASFDGIVVSGGTIYAALINEVTWHLTVHTYSLAEDTWALVCERPPEVQLGAIALAVVDERVFTAGGFTRAGRRVNTVLMFSISANEWQVLPSMPRPRSGCSSFVYDGCLCYAGGSESAGIKSNTIDGMSLDTYEWKSLPSTAAAGGAITTLYGTLIVTGGIRDSDRPSRRVEMLDSDNAWMPLPCLLGGRYFHEMCIDTEGPHIRAFVAGGYDKNERKTSTVEVIELM